MTSGQQFTDVGLCVCDPTVAKWLLQAQGLSLHTRQKDEGKCGEVQIASFIRIARKFPETSQYTSTELTG